MKNKIKFNKDFDLLEKSWIRTQGIKKRLNKLGIAPEKGFEINYEIEKQNYESELKKKEKNKGQ